MDRLGLRVAVLRALVRLWPGGFAPLLVAALMRAAGTAGLRGRTPSAAVVAAAEAVQVARRLAASGPGGGLLLARALACYAARLYDRGTYDAALTHVSEAIGRFESCDTGPGWGAGLADARVVHALVLEQLGRHDEALAAGLEAVADWRRQPPGKAGSRAGLAHALDCLAGCLGRVGRHEEAVAAGLEAVDLFRRLPPRKRLGWLVRITSVRVRLADNLRQVGRCEEAIAQVDAATTWAQAAAQRYPHKHRSTVAWLRHVEALTAGDLGRHRRAVEAAEDAVTHYRWLADRDRDVYEPHLAAVLRCLADARVRAGEPAEADEAFAEAVAIRARLAKDAAEQALALGDDLGAWSDALWAAGARERASTVTGRAVEAYRQIVTDDLGHAARLVAALTTAAARSEVLGQAEDAVAAAREAVTVARRLAVADSQAWDPLLALTLDTLATILAATGFRPDALEAAYECVIIRRRLADAEPGIYRPDLAAALTNLGNRLVQTGNASEAIPAYEEAVALHRDTVAEPDQRAALALTLTNLAVPLADKNIDEAIGCLDEAIAIRTLLSADNPEPALAAALRRRAFYLAQTGRHAQALPDLHTAAGIYRTLAAADPATHLENLALCLGMTALHHAELGHLHEATDTLHDLHHLASGDAPPQLGDLYEDAVAAVQETAPDTWDYPMPPPPDPTTVTDTETDTGIGADQRDADQAPTTSAKPIDTATARQLARHARAAATNAHHAFTHTVGTLGIRHRVGGGVAASTDLAARYLTECADLLTPPRPIRRAVIAAVEIVAITAPLAVAIHQQWGPVTTGAALFLGFPIGQILATAIKTFLDRYDQRTTANDAAPPPDQAPAPPPGTIAELKAEVRRARAEIAAARANLAPITSAVLAQLTTMQVNRCQRRHAHAAQLASDADALLNHADARLYEYLDGL